MRQINGLILFTALFLLASCTERINDLQLDNTYTRLTVYGELTDEPGHPWVRLTTTADYFINKPSPTVSGATVYIIDGKDTVYLPEEEHE